MAIEKKLNYRNSSIFYRIYGKGKPVMLVHGFGETSDVWKNQVDLPQTPSKGGGLEESLQKNEFMFIVPDLPGSGQSEMIDDMSMEGMAEVLKMILDLPVASSRGGGMIGHSMGGYITLAFAEKYPEYLNAFGLFHSTAYADSEEKKATRRKGIEFIKQNGSYEFLKTATPNLFSPDTKAKLSPGSNMMSDLIEKGKDFQPEALIAYYEAMIQRPDRTAVLKNSRVPVLFVIGESDNAVSPQDMLKQSHLPERASIHILRHSGHMGMLEEIEKSNRLLKGFLNSY